MWDCVGVWDRSSFMASIRKYARSPFWYLRKRDLDTGKCVEEALGLRTDDSKETRKAQRIAEEHSCKERQVAGTKDNPAFVFWVPGYLRSHYAQKSPETQRRMQTAWQAIKVFLKAEDITYPRQVKYHHGKDYIQWRLQNKIHDGRAVGHNTALLELKFLSQLMNEAIRLEYAEANPLLRMGIPKQQQKEKPELSDEEIQTLRTYLKDQPEWMQVCFEISLYTGCRFNECAVQKEDIDLESGTLRLRDSKRKSTDPKKFFTVPIHPDLEPTLKRVFKEGAVAVTREKNWRINRAFQQAGVNASFHSLRVTFITRCHRGGLTQVEAMRLVNHSSQAIHKIYSKLNAEDARAAQAKIPLPVSQKSPQATP